MIRINRSSMKQLALAAVGACLLGNVSIAAADTSVTVDPAATYFGFANVFDLSNNYIFSSGWGASDIPGTFSGPVLTLTGNTSVARDLSPTTGSFDSFWFRLNGSGQLEGNRIFDGSFYAEDRTLGGSPVTFSGTVLSNTLVSGYSSTAFIRVFDGAFNLLDSITAPLTPGNFSISRTPVPDTIVQYGFNITGPNLATTDTTASGAVRVTATVVPEPAAASLLLLGVPVLARRNRRA